ncbi:MAG: hypothetical protein K2X90_00090 [Candidatus Babeliaceae bacterium]|nr:hypothetical protein [Candidatus Babeliaceae bacterium]
MKIAVAEKVFLAKSPAEKNALDKNPGEKFNVAWFKLAEFVGRKEKERALGVYRLLSHSLPDDAFAAQIEGDLLMAFGDEKAVDAYQKAAWLYEKSNQFDHAALLYEQMLMLKPENRDFLVQALKLYQLVKNDVKIVRCASQLARLLIKHGAVDELNDLMAACAYQLDYQLYIQESIILALLEFQPAQEQSIQDYLTYVVSALERPEYKNRLTLFFAKLSALSPLWYDRACALLRQDKQITA